MTVKISGVLKDGTGKPVQNCTIVLKARRTSSTVVVNTVASENPDEAGRYTMDVEYGQYSVSLLVEGFPPSHAGTITVYEDSQPGTLNDFLGAMTEDDARPEALRRFEVMVEEVARNASAVAQNTAVQQRGLLPQRRHPRRTRKRRKPAQNPQKRLPHRPLVRRRHRHHRRQLQKMRRPDRRQQRRAAPRQHPRRRQRQLAVRRRQHRAKVRRNPRQRAPRQRQNGQRILHPPWRLRMQVRRKRG